MSTSKYDKFKEEFENSVSTRDGEVIDLDELYKILSSLKKDDRIAGSKKGMKIMWNKSKIKKLSPLNKGCFGLKAITSADISIQARGLLDFLTDNLRGDGSCKVDLPCDHTKTALSGYLKVSMKTLNRAIDELSSLSRLIYEQNGKSTFDIYINPDFFRVGNMISENAMELFGFL